jgi:hypothetical protein
MSDDPVLNERATSALGQPSPALRLIAARARQAYHAAGQVKAASVLPNAEV